MRDKKAGLETTKINIIKLTVKINHFELSNANQIKVSSTEKTSQKKEKGKEKNLKIDSNEKEFERENANGRYD